MAENYIATVFLWAGARYVPEGYVTCNGALYSVNQYTAAYSLVGSAFGGDTRTTFGVPNLVGRTAIGPGVIPGTTTQVALGQTTGTAILTSQVTATGSITLTTANLPGHTHPATFNPITASQTVPISQAGNLGVNIPVNPTVPSTNTPATLSGAQNLSNYQAGLQTSKGGFVSSITGTPVMLATGTNGVQVTGSPGITANPTISVVSGGNVAVQSNNFSPATPATVIATGSAQGSNNLQPSFALAYIFCMTGIYPPQP